MDNSGQCPECLRRFDPPVSQCPTCALPLKFALSDDLRATALRILDEHLDSPTLAAAIADAIRAAVEVERAEVNRLRALLKQVLLERIPEIHQAATEAERKKVARWMMENGFATGHGDTIEDLLVELEGQLVG